MVKSDRIEFLAILRLKKIRKEKFRWPLSSRGEWGGGLSEQAT